MLNALANVGFWAKRTGTNRCLPISIYEYTALADAAPRRERDQIGRYREAALIRRPKRFVSKKHEKCHAQCQREYTDAHDQHREQLTLRCTVIGASPQSSKGVGATNS